MEDRTEDGGLLPSVVASDEEFYAPAEVLGELGMGHVGLTLGYGLTLEERRAVRNLVAQTMRISRRPFHLLDVQLGEDPEWEQSCRAEGLPLFNQNICIPSGVQMKLSEYNMYDFMPAWVEPLVGSPEERSAKLDSLVKSLFRSNQNKRTLAWVQYTVSVPHTTPTYGSAQMC